MYPIWKDTYYSNYFETLEYYLKDVDEDKIVHQAYTKKMPGWTGVTLNINNMVDEHLKPDFAEDFTQVSDAVVANPNAYKLAMWAFESKSALERASIARDAMAFYCRDEADIMNIAPGICASPLKPFTTIFRSWMLLLSSDRTKDTVIDSILSVLDVPE